MLNVTKTDIAKMAVSMVVSRKAADASEHVAVNHFNLDEDSTTVTVGSTVFGAVVSYKLRPLTDAAVDKTVARYQSWRSSRKETPAE